MPVNAQTMDDSAGASLMARLMAVAGHDLRQPLQAAITSIELAMRDGVDSRAEGRLRLATAALGRLGCELEDLARSSQSARIRPQNCEVRLDLLCQDLLQDWRVFAAAARVTLRFAVPPVTVRSDPAMLASILRNLVGNAIKYSRPGGRVLVGVRRRGTNVRLEVHDNGRGIAADRLEQVFDAFERGDAGDAVAGLGLGLFLVRQTAEMLRHPVHVVSRQGVGSAFSVTLPLAFQG